MQLVYAETPRNIARSQPKYNSRPNKITALSVPMKILVYSLSRVVRKENPVIPADTIQKMLIVMTDLLV